MSLIELVQLKPRIYSGYSDLNLFNAYRILGDLWMNRKNYNDWLSIYLSERSL